MSSPSRVFISYRRAEQDGAARLIHGYLAKRFGESSVFMDIKGIKAGDVFRQTIAKELQSCSAMIVVIGKEWAGSSERQARLHEEGDFVRLEIEAALKRGVQVIPVLVYPAKMPDRSHLPDDLKPLVGIQHQEVQLGQRFEDDMERIVRAIRPEKHKARTLRVVAIVAVSALALGGIAYLLKHTPAPTDVVADPPKVVIDTTKVDHPAPVKETHRTPTSTTETREPSHTNRALLPTLEFMSEGSLEDRLTLMGLNTTTVHVSGELNRKQVEGRLRLEGSSMVVDSRNGTLVSGSLSLSEDQGLLRGSLTVLSPSGMEIPLRVNMVNAAR